jgi:hypothetical protein
MKGILEYIAKWVMESQPTFQKNMPPPSSQQKGKSSKKSAWSKLYMGFSCYNWPPSLLWLPTGFFPGLPFISVDEGDIILQKNQFIINGLHRVISQKPELS